MPNPPLRGRVRPGVEFHFGEQVAGRRIPPRKVDAGRLADHAAPPVAAHHIVRSQKLSTRQPDVDARAVVGDARHLPSAIDPHLQLLGPLGQDAFDMLLPQRKPVRVPGRKVADLQADLGEPRDLGGPPLGQEAFGDPALIEDLDGA